MHIVQTDVFRAAAEAIACLQPCPIEGRVTPDQVKIALGELLDVWPRSIFESEGDGVEFIDSGESISREPDFISEEEDKHPRRD